MERAARAARSFSFGEAEKENAEALSALRFAEEEGVHTEGTEEAHRVHRGAERIRMVSV
jgi:hypothetical protein